MLEIPKDVTLLEVLRDVTLLVLACSEKDLL